MSGKRILMVLGGVVVVSLVVFLSVRFLLKKPLPATSRTYGTNLVNVNVVSWDPGSAMLQATLADGQAASFRLVPPGTVIVIPISAPGEPKNETIVFNVKRSTWWQTAFCPGDTIRVTIADSDADKLGAGGAVVPKEVRSAGPRACAF